MILSMTGYGRVSQAINGKEVTVEIRTLNSRYFDLNLRIPAELRSIEPTIRSNASKRLMRGKVDFSINVEGEGIQTQKVDKTLVEKYYKELKEVSDKLGAETDLMSSILRFPDVMIPIHEAPDEEEQAVILKAVETAINQVEEFRKQEGDATGKDMLIRAENILLLLKEVEQNEETRRDHMRNRIENLANEYLTETKVDQNRMEEELIYYLEKMDITEEKVRLENHCNYLIELLDNEDTDSGKRLNFVCQEIGREINTIGSKASYAPIQRLVVQMKDDLEKMKEQVMNIL